MAARPLSLYLHIPFCTLKCAYCDFNSYAASTTSSPPSSTRFIDEIHVWSPLMKGRPVSSVFFGGGTPSLLPLSGVERILYAVRRSFDIASDAEITLEANPGTVDLPYLRGLRISGVNRLSFGVQSFDDAELKSIDRIHTAAEAVEAYNLARKAGFDRINLDLIYGLPNQTLARWKDNVEPALTLGPEHLSMYALTIEEGTKLAYDVAHNLAPEPDPDLQAEMYEWTQGRLADSGYQQYEISNWSRPGEECRHNLAYWHNDEWLGLGPGAHSHWGNYRFADVYSPRRYIDLVAETAGDSPHDEDPARLLAGMRQVSFVDPQPLELQMADTIILALRLNRGLDVSQFERRFGRHVEDVYGPVIDEAMQSGLLERANGHLLLTDNGRYVANELFVRLLPD
jgi:putative oxygen-independent coproporphyrinogen III oxidase